MFASQSTLSDGVMVAPQFLVLLVKVRVLVGQRKKPSFWKALFFCLPTNQGQVSITDKAKSTRN